MVIPGDGPAAERAAAVLHEREGESGTTQTTESVGYARGRRNVPACRRRARFGRDAMTQEKAETAAVTRSQCQPTRGGEISGGAVIRQLGDNGGEHARLERLFHGPEH